jgi:NADPH:quinone reductase-like Zn-dependent oxidoreductase
MGPDELAALPCVALTAYYALLQLATPAAAPGKTVLVHSAAGGVGSCLVQLAKIHGCRVVGVVGRTAKVEACLSIGCDVVVDKQTEDLWSAVAHAAPKGYDAVFDANGVATLRGGYDALAPEGRLVVYGFHTMLPKKGGRLTVMQWCRMAWRWLWSPTFDPFKMVPANKSVMAFNLSWLFVPERVGFFRKAMADIFRWAGEGRLRVLRVTRFPMSRAAEAHAAIESGKSVGKLVLDTQR